MVQGDEIAASCMQCWHPDALNHHPQPGNSHTFNVFYSIKYLTEPTLVVVNSLALSKVSSLPQPARDFSVDLLQCDLILMVCYSRGPELILPGVKAWHPEPGDQKGRNS